jgi:DNA modification methylase
MALYQDAHVTLYAGDALDVLRQLPAQSVQTVVTSPPYFQLRDYQTATWHGGDPECDHLESREFVNPKNTLGPNGHLPQTNAANKMHTRQYRDTCGKCGATRVDSQLGLEETPGEYVEALVAVFREVRRVLRDDGTAWVNLGDSFAANRSYQVSDSKHLVHNYGESNATRIPPGLKPKDLIGIPWRVAFALQADGWYLRSDIIWAKPNPMPESVTDRPTKAHEYLFLLSKSKSYYYDADAIREPLIKGDANSGAKNYRVINGASLRDDSTQGRDDHPLGRNRRSVWTVATQPYSGAHFACFPPKLIEPCILAGAPEGGVVLDPFIGSGTTAVTAKRLGRRCIGIDLSERYLRDLAIPRLYQQALPLEATP